MVDLRLRKTVLGGKSCKSETLKGFWVVPSADLSRVKPLNNVVNRLKTAATNGIPEPLEDTMYLPHDAVDRPTILRVVEIEEHAPEGHGFFFLELGRIVLGKAHPMLLGIGG